MAEWSNEIEKAYQAWIHSPKLFGHWADEGRFYEFVWACVDNPNEAPDDGTFRVRMAEDTKLAPDAEGFPHQTVAKAVLLYNHLRAFAEKRQ